MSFHFASTQCFMKHHHKFEELSNDENKMKDFEIIPSIESSFVFQRGRDGGKHNADETKYACEINTHMIGNVDYLEFS